MDGEVYLVQSGVQFAAGGLVDLGDHDDQGQLEGDRQFQVLGGDLLQATHRVDHQQGVVGQVAAHACDQCLRVLLAACDVDEGDDLAGQVQQLLGGVDEAQRVVRDVALRVKT